MLQEAADLVYNDYAEDKSHPSSKHDGPWAKDSEHLINIEWLLGLAPGQMDGLMRQKATAKWVRRAELLGIEGESTEMVLKGLRAWISWTSPDNRCPCRNGVVPARAKEHWPNCDGQWALRTKRAEEKKLEGEERQLQRKREELDARFERESLEALHLGQILKPSLLSHLPNAISLKLYELAKKNVESRGLLNPEPVAKRLRFENDEEEDGDE